MIRLVSPRSLRRRVLQAIENELGGDGWAETRHAFSSFPGADTRHQEHKAYAVWVPADKMSDDDRQRSAQGMLRTARLLVRYSYRLRPAEVSVDTDLALEAEERIVIAMRTAATEPGLAIRIGDIDRSHTADGALQWGEISAVVVAGYPLA